VRRRRRRYKACRCSLSQPRPGSGGSPVYGEGSGLTAWFLGGKSCCAPKANGYTFGLRRQFLVPAGRRRSPARTSQFPDWACRQMASGRPLVRGVRYRELYPGIDMIYGGNGRRFEVGVCGGARRDPLRIRIRYAGAGRQPSSRAGTCRSRREASGWARALLTSIRNEMAPRNGGGPLCAVRRRHGGICAGPVEPRGR